MDVSGSIVSYHWGEKFTRLMALAIHFDGLIQSGAVANYAELARLGNVTRARMTQIMNLLIGTGDSGGAFVFAAIGTGGRRGLFEGFAGGGVGGCMGGTARFVFRTIDNRQMQFSSSVRHHGCRLCRSISRFGRCDRSSGRCETKAPSVTGTAEYISVRWFLQRTSNDSRSIHPFTARADCTGRISETFASLSERVDHSGGNAIA